MSEIMHVISLGAGVQSSTVIAMADRGEILPRPAWAIMADTMWEPKAVYEWLDSLEKKVSIPVLRVSKGDLGADGLKVIRSKKSGNLYQKNLIPLFTLSPEGEKGILGRKCTSEYKVREIQKKQRELLPKGMLAAWRKKHRAALREVERCKKAKLPLPLPEYESMQADALIVCWIGISEDESHRVKFSQVPWIKNRYPLLEKNMTRSDCLTWMERAGFSRPPRSACIFCPYHSDDEWMRLKKELPAEFDAAVQWEKEAQEANRLDEVTRGVVYLHADRVPLDRVVFKLKQIPVPGSKNGNLDMFEEAGFNLECEGMCGI